MIAVAGVSGVIENVVVVAASVEIAEGAIVTEVEPIAVDPKEAAVMAVEVGKKKVDLLKVVQPKAVAEMAAVAKVAAVTVAVVDTMKVDLPKVDLLREDGAKVAAMAGHDPVDHATVGSAMVGSAMVDGASQAEVTRRVAIKRRRKPPAKGTSRAVMNAAASRRVAKDDATKVAKTAARKVDRNRIAAEVNKGEVNRIEVLKAAVSNKIGRRKIARLKIEPVKATNVVGMKVARGAMICGKESASSTSMNRTT